jgi:hypothetical protein
MRDRARVEVSDDPVRRRRERCGNRAVRVDERKRNLLFEHAGIGRTVRFGEHGDAMRSRVEIRCRDDRKETGVLEVRAANRSATSLRRSSPRRRFRARRRCASPTDCPIVSAPAEAAIQPLTTRVSPFVKRGRPRIAVCGWLVAQKRAHAVDEADGRLAQVQVSHWRAVFAAEDGICFETKKIRKWSTRLGPRRPSILNDPASCR